MWQKGTRRIKVGGGAYKKKKKVNRYAPITTNARQTIAEHQEVFIVAKSFLHVFPKASCHWAHSLKIMYNHQLTMNPVQKQQQQAGCPFCFAPTQSQGPCSCILGCNTCVQGHMWFYCPKHKRVVENSDSTDMHHFAISSQACLCLGDELFQGKKCPGCTANVVQICSCRLHDGRCAQGHAWHICQAHGSLVWHGMRETTNHVHHLTGALQPGQVICTCGIEQPQPPPPNPPTQSQQHTAHQQQHRDRDSRVKSGLKQISAQKRYPQQSSEAYPIGQAYNTTRFDPILINPGDRRASVLQGSTAQVKDDQDGLQDSMAWSGSSTASTQEDLWSGVDDDLETPVDERLYPPEQDHPDYISQTQQGRQFADVESRQWLPTHKIVSETRYPTGK
jgi:hypothetical protein